jgi:DNA-binding MarR family transcriptional regulator
MEMPKSKPSLKPQEIQILKTLLEHDYHMNTTQVAKITGISWNTADKHLKKFYELGWIERVERGNRDYWRAYRE